jgi:hypothetical protein
MQQVEDTGYFLSQEKCVGEIMREEGHSPESKSNPSDPPKTDTSKNIFCCWSNILLHQSDFFNGHPFLQEIIEDAGHIFLFLPKFHCELNPIELYWSYNTECKYQFHIHPFIN